MGLFSKREPCALCGGKVKGLFPWNLEGQLICDDCHGTVDVQQERDPKTIEAFRKYQLFRAENQKLRQSFHTDFCYDIGLFSNKPVFDFTNHLFCFDKNLSTTIFKMGEVREFVISEDRNIIFRGNPRRLEEFDSVIPGQVHDMAPVIHHLAMEIERYEREEQMRRRQEEDARRRGMPPPPHHPHPSRPSIPKPFDQFVITFRFRHPYWDEKTITVDAPSFGYNHPNTMEYLKDYQRKYDEILNFANAVARTLFPNAGMGVPAPVQRAARTSAPDAAADNTADTVVQLRQFKQLLDEGIITQEEFDAKKKQLMGI